MNDLIITNRVKILKEKMLSEVRYASIEQAIIITDTYKSNEDKPRIIQRALALKNAMEKLQIKIEPEELIVGNRTSGVRGGVIFPESGISWIDDELDTLNKRPQDKFNVIKNDIDTFRRVISPYWKGKSLEDIIKIRYGKEIKSIEKVVKINQKDHAQGHICPDVEGWLAKGPKAIKEDAKIKLKMANSSEKADFYQSVIYVIDGMQSFMLRYADLLKTEAEKPENINNKTSMLEVAGICTKLSEYAPTTFHEAVQSIWFLFTALHMESNASSFSPGRMDSYLYPFYRKDIDENIIDHQKALEILECLWLKFNQIVYLRNSHSAKFFAGFPIGFNIAVGGQDKNGNNFENELTFLLLEAQKHLGLPQPNLSVRLHKNTSQKLLRKSVEVVSKGSGMPQFFNDNAIVPSLIKMGINEKDALDYAIVGCVEVTTQGNMLGWSDAAMFNLNKVLELTLTGGVCLITGEQLAPNYGDITTYKSYNELETVFSRYLDEFIDKMQSACRVVEQAHIELLPSPFLSSVVMDCLENGRDVTAGGAIYNLSGIQMIQIANLADSMAALKKLVFEDSVIDKKDLLKALKNNFEGYETLRLTLINKAPKYGNDIDSVDNIGVKWAEYFRDKLSEYSNYRGGRYHTGMYTVSAHVPMGENVGASPDGRFSREPLADGGMSAVYGRDRNGPTAVLKSVSKLDKNLTSNGGLLNLKFLPNFFSTQSGVDNFANFLRGFVDLEIPHIQFNVVNKEDLVEAKKNPEKYSTLTIRVAGYTAYFIELADKLQEEIIARTSYGGL